MNRARSIVFMSAAVAALSLQSCRDPGHDPSYGQGRINVARALGVAQLGAR